MGRKIPAKKHRGVKDPLVQQARRLQSLKGKINAPPKDPDEQPIPRSVTQLFAFQNKENKKKKEKNKRVPSRDDPKVSNAGSNPIARLKKLPGESGRGFSLRINSAIKALHDPMEQLDYPQDDEVDDMKGERMAAQRERRQRKHKAAIKKDPTLKNEPKITRTQKLALKKQAKKLKTAEESRAEVSYERVQFGELAHAPPTLCAPRRAPPTAKPGRRDLLLTSLLGAGGAGGAEGAGGAAELERRERVRLDVVAAYRALKKQRRLDQAGARKRS